MDIIIGNGRVTIIGADSAMYLKIVAHCKQNHLDFGGTVTHITVISEDTEKVKSEIEALLNE